MNTTEQKRRNEQARKDVEKLNSELGIRLNHIGKLIGIKSASSFTQWRKGLYDFGKDRLNKLDGIIDNYKNL